MNIEEKQTPEEGTQPAEGAINPLEMETPQNPDEEIDGQDPQNTENPEEKPEDKEPQAPDNQPKVDYREKFANSTRENQVLTGKIQQMETRLNSLTNEEIPTDKEMASLYPEWDELGNLEKNILKKNVVLERRINKTHSITLGIAEEKEWNGKLDKFIEQAAILDQYQGLKGKEKEFKEFAKKPSHKGIDLSILANAFLYEVKSEEPPKKNSGSMLERGSGGPKTPQSAELTAEQVAEIRKNDPKRYNLLVKQGKI